VNVQWIQPGTTLDTKRGDVVVCIPVYGGHELFVGCLRSVLAHTAAEITILMCDDASPDPRSQDFVARLADVAESEHDVYYLRRERNLGFPANVNGAFDMAAPADVVVLNSDVVVGEGWLEGLRDAAYSDSRVATATALTNHGSLVSVPDRRPAPKLPPEWSLDAASAVVRARSLKLRPRLPTGIGHCMYVRRSALELIGTFDLAFTPGYGEEVDFSQRCIRSGLSHVLADDVLVLHHGGASFSHNGKRNPAQDAHEKIIETRYPYYHHSVRMLEEDVAGPLCRALSAARRALRGISVVIDGRVLSGPMTGTQLHVLELVAALARTGEAAIRVVIPETLSSYAKQALAVCPGVELVTRWEALDARIELADVVHRPYQVGTDEDLSFLARLGERLIVTNQDLIAYHNPSYFPDFDSWEGYRRITRSALAVADRVMFFSAHARDDAVAEDLVETGRASVVHIGVDHVLTRVPTEPVAPRGTSRLPDGAEVILCIGTDFRHKNRTFALRMLEQLQRRHRWGGYLVLVGPAVSRGSSSADEAEVIALRPRLADAVLSLAAVSEAEKTWLFERARLVVYPTVHEGFGLVPFEAADHGVACMWAKGTSLSELLPDEAAAIVPWDAELSADAAFRLLSEPEARERNVAAIRSAAAQLVWDSTASRLLALYHETCDRPATPASAIERRSGLMTGTFSEDAIRLIGPGGALPEDVERPLLAFATHPQVGAPMFGVLKFGYRAGYRLRRIRRGEPKP
jgi:GT2 family glycosyltransferase/glycosyltransferase involved in cell wall biosynthesis